MIPRRVAVTGTDTGVGKTLAATLVALALKKAGLRVTVAKPVESGLEQHLPGAGDAERLARVADDRRPLSRISPYRFRAPLAPTVAAEQEGVPIDPLVVRACLREALAAGDATVVEGAGGLLAPLAPEELL